MRSNYGLRDFNRECANLIPTLSVWHDNSYPHALHTHIKIVEDELLKIQSKNISPENIQNEASIQLELEHLSLKQSHFWKQRSKCFWLNEMDRNTKYFHTIANHRKRRKNIVGIIIITEFGFRIKGISTIFSEIIL